MSRAWCPNAGLIFRFDATVKQFAVCCSIVSKRQLGNRHWVALRSGSGMHAVHGVGSWHTEVRMHGSAKALLHNDWKVEELGGN